VVEDETMSIGSLGLIGSLVTTPLAQKANDADKTVRDAADQAREVQANRQAEAAAGIGETEEDSQASERDADGRRLWEQPLAKQTPPEESDESEEALPLLSKDPSGESGGELDLLG
jgi:hypothetical protein